MDKKTQPDKFYVDLSLTNNETTKSIPAEVISVRDQVILDNPEDYEMSIVRFECSQELIPIFIPATPDPLFPFRSQFSITLFYAGVYYQQFITIDPTEKQFGVFNFGIWIEHYNVAAALAFAAIVGPITATRPPYFYYNPLINRTQIFVQTDYLESNPNRIQIAIDEESLKKLNLPARVFNGFGTPFGFDAVLAVGDYAILVPPHGSRTNYPYFLTTTGAAAGDFLQISEEYVSSSNWSFVKGIVFTTNMIPVVRSYLPSSTGGLGQGGNVARQFLPTLTDFALIKDSNVANTIRGTAVYLPTAEFRRLSMYRSSNFSTMDFKAYIQTYDLQLIPINLAPGDNVSLKVLFERKK